MGLRRTYVGWYLKRMIPPDGKLLFSKQAEPCNERFHACTVANRRKKHLDKLIRSCKRSKVDLQILGLGRDYPGNYIKITWFLEYLDTLDDDEIVMFVDGYDVLVLAEPSRLIKTFKGMDAPIVIAAERGCFPFPELADQYPQSPTSFRYINSGTFIGYVGHMKKWLVQLDVTASKSDQGLITRDHLSDPCRVPLVLDYCCQLFLPLYKVNRDELKIRRGELQCRETKTFPCVVHANGESAGDTYPMFFEIYKKLINCFSIEKV